MNLRGSDYRESKKRELVDKTVLLKSISEQKLVALRSETLHDALTKLPLAQRMLIERNAAKLAEILNQRLREGEPRISYTAALQIIACTGIMLNRMENEEINDGECYEPQPAN